MLKLQDARGDTRPEFGTLVPTHREAVEHALDHIGVANRNRVLTTDSAVPGARAASCGRPDYAEWGRARDLYNSLVGQLNNKHAVHDLIVAEEARNGTRERGPLLFKLSRACLARAPRTHSIPMVYPHAGSGRPA